MAENDLGTLLAGLNPKVRQGEYVVVETDQNLPAVAVIYEDEATTRIMLRDIADQHGLSYEFVGAWITLTIESDLAAVGLTAAVSTALASAGIACNVIAASRHDHLLVPVDRQDDAIEVLKALGPVH